MAFIKGFLPDDIRTHRQIDAIRQELTTEEAQVTRADFDAQERFINFQNGVLDTKTVELLPHAPEYLQVRQLPCDYNPEATMAQAPVFCKFLNDLLPGDTQTQAFLLEYMGACFSSVFGYRFKKCLLLVGPGNTGKTQLRSLIEQIIGADYCMSVDMKELNKNQFAPSMLEGKRFSGSGDMSYMQLDELNILKSLTGGDTLFAERKHKDAFSLTYTGFLWFNANQLPYFRGDRGEHIYTRMMIVCCNNPIPVEQQDRNLLEKMLREKGAIINLAIKFYLQAVERGYQFTESDAMHEARADYKIENNSLLCFVKMRCSANEGECKRSDFNRRYEHWCRQNAITAEKLKERAAQLESEFGIVARKTYSGHMYYDIKLLEDDEDDYDPDEFRDAVAKEMHAFFAKRKK